MALELEGVSTELYEKIVNRRSFVKGFGLAGIGVAAAGLSACNSSTMAMAATSTSATADTAQQIFTAALIAEGLAITMYYNALVGGVIQDPNLAGSGGTALKVTSSGSVSNVAYLQGALSEEIQHANLLRSLVAPSGSASGDPVQTFYFPTGTFDNLQNFFPIVNALETAFIGAYMTAVQEFALMIGNVSPYSSTQASATAGTNYTTAQLAAFAKISASILGVEAEHRTLARAIPPPGMFAGVSVTPSDNLCYESNASLTDVYNDKGTSAVAALTPFLSASSSNPVGFSYATALAGSTALIASYGCTGMPPS